MSIDPSGGLPQACGATVPYAITNTGTETAAGPDSKQTALDAARKSADDSNDAEKATITCQSACAAGRTVTNEDPDYDAVPPGFVPIQTSDNPPKTVGWKCTVKRVKLITIECKQG